MILFIFRIKYNTCKFVFISKIRQHLDYDTATRLVHALVTSRLDSCNSLLYGLPEKDLAKLQRIQNIAARLICRVPPSHHITPILQNLHWLPVNIASHRL